MKRIEFHTRKLFFLFVYSFFFLRSLYYQTWGSYLFTHLNDPLLCLHIVFFSTTFFLSSILFFSVYPVQPNSNSPSKFYSTTFNWFYLTHRHQQYISVKKDLGLKQIEGGKNEHKASWGQLGSYLIEIYQTWFKKWTLKLDGA